MKMENACRYKTKDLAEAAFLYASNQKLTGLEKDGNRVWFVFINENDACETLVNSYWSRDAIVNAKEFADAIRSLKDIIFNRERS